MSSDTTVSDMVEMEGKPWAEYRRDGRALTKHALARLLKPFGVVPSTIRQGTTTPKGYQIADFKPVWDRYLSGGGEPNRNTPQPKESATYSENQTATRESDVAVWNRLKATESATCGVLRSEKGGLEERGEEGGEDDDHDSWLRGDDQ